LFKGQLNFFIINPSFVPKSRRQNKEKYINTLTASVSERDADLRNLREKLDKQKEDLEKMNEKLKTEFKNLANEILEEKTKKFTEMNDQPGLARVLPDITMDEDAVDMSLNLSNYFTDPDLPYGDSLSYSFRDNGTVSVTMALNGTVTLAPRADWSGKQNVTLVARDKSSKEASDTIQVSVIPIPDSPFVTATSHMLYIDEDTVLNISIAQRFSDPDLPVNPRRFYRIASP
jgi:hypothetical protein